MSCALFFKHVKKMNFTSKQFIKKIHSAHGIKIEHLKRTFELFNKPNHYDQLLCKYPIISKLKRCSILMPITIKHEKNEKGLRIQKSYFTLIKRPDTIEASKSQVCFVGGKREINDKNDIITAFREAKKINVCSNRLTVLAELCPIMTTNGNLITPIIAYFDDTDFEPMINRNEVDYVFKLPTERFVLKDRHSSECYKVGNTKHSLHYFEDMVQGKLLKTWGFTAFVSILASSILHSRIPEFLVDEEIPLNNENIIEYFDLYLEKNIKTI